MRIEIGAGILLAVLTLLITDGVLSGAGTTVVGSVLIAIGLVLFRYPRRCKHLDTRAVQDHIGVLSFSVEKECVHCGKRLPR